MLSRIIELIPFLSTLRRLLPPSLYLRPSHLHVGYKCLFKLVSDQDALLFPPHLTQPPPLQLHGLRGLVQFALPLHLSGCDCGRLI